ncbi:hypothetical protein WN48_04178 [Eufriesea mexicana]|uniref:Uncharacterized protein n=1 Tax=Eufriesea mexicana TaxID=516756 RepID=A0A310SA76_9HYME|nr:hypothetical protein WN48_04178 [Eufriesea mexicana]
MDHVRVNLYGADFKNEQRAEKKGESEDERGKNKNDTFERRSERSIDYERFSYFVEESSATNRITHTFLKQRQTGEEQREKIRFATHSRDT